VKIPYEWLNEFVVLDMDPYELASKLTMRGFEVEAIEEYKPSLDGVCVGEVVTIDLHPIAKNLTICKVRTEKEELPIICGAKNIQKGDKVPVAIVGSTLAGGLSIEKKNIRGVESLGMLCSEKELGLSDDHSGIFILPREMKPGTNLEEMAGLRDFVFDINVPPNRGDCLSVYGIAREVGSILNQRAKLPMFKLSDTIDEEVKNLVSLDIKDLDACPRYVLRMINDISMVQAPFWMRQRIQKCGMRPINAIVDVTNYVMLELGQPLHAFDYHSLRDKRIEVRVANKETIFKTLDGEDRKLVEGDILICDGSGPVALAGIMGGENSEITENTKDIALESAFFNPLFIRQTARRLGIRSEASLRFEKGIDLDNVDFAAERAIYLMNLTAGGTVVKGKQEIYEKKSSKSIFVSFGKIIDVLGTPVEHSTIISSLRSVDLHIVKEEETGFIVSVPNFRHDLDEYADIIEEVARIYGYDHIPVTTPVGASQAHKRGKSSNLFKGIKEYFTACGFFELINFAFFSVKDIENFLLQPSDERFVGIPIMNPISKDYEVMRTFIAPNVLKSVAYNLNRGAKNLRFFEMGKVFHAGCDTLPLEYPAICFVMTGKERDYFWRDPCPEYDFFDSKGIIEGIATRFKVNFDFAKSNEPFLKKNGSADILLEGAKIGWLGEIEENVLHAYNIEQKVYCAEIRFDIMMQKGFTDVEYKAIPRYPQVTRDFAFLVEDAVPVATMLGQIKTISPLITSVGVFDMFKKEVKSIALRVVFQSYEETLTDETVNALQEVIIQKVTSIPGVTLRT
jgi:phenylalanyl-tRNA synthetase beta chain